MSTPLLRIENLYVEFKTGRGVIRPINGISLEVDQGETFGIVGETGCGKTVTGLSILRLLPPTATVTQGKIFFEGKNLLELSENEMRQVRGKRISFIFQDPSSSLNPLFSVGKQIDKVIREHQKISTGSARQQTLKMLQTVGLADRERVYDMYPHQLSGGMLQRVMIAMSLACEHTLIVADEPTTALDVTIQSQILHLMHTLQEEYGISLILITHNLGIVAEMCSRMAVLYAGKVVESGPTAAIYRNPQHPYTQGLLRTIPRPATRKQKLESIPGNVPADPGLMPGCVFAPRCKKALPRCTQESPAPFLCDDDHFSACFFAETKGRMP